MIKCFFLAIVSTVVAASFAIAGPSHTESHLGSLEFERLKLLVGEWQGTSHSIHDTEPQPVSATYRLTSAGTALVETLFAGSKHEMVSIFHDRDQKLKLTHYCALNNQPELALKEADERRMGFEFVSGDNIESATSTHMNRLEIEFNGPNSIVERWTLKEAGVETTTTTILLNRRASETN